MKDTPENSTQYTFTQEQIAQADTAKLLEEDAVLAEYTDRLDALRKNGVNKVSALTQEIAAVRKNKLISAEEKNTRIAAYRKEIEDAKTVAARHKDEEKELTHKAIQRVNALSDAFEQEVKKNENAKAARNTRRRCKALRRRRRKRSRRLPPLLRAKPPRKNGGKRSRN